MAGEEPPREAVDVPRLEELGRYPAGIVRIIRKATCRNPDDRYQMLDQFLSDVGEYRQHGDVGMVHPEVEDRNTGILSVVPDAPEEPETVAAPTEIPSDPVTKAKAVSEPVKIGKLVRGAGLALAFAGIAFLVSDYMAANNALQPLTLEQSSELSSFVREASLTQSQPPVLFVHVDESWELLSSERRQEEAETMFRAASERWGTRDGFIHRGNALVAHRWDEQVTVFGSLHGDVE